MAHTCERCVDFRPLGREACGRVHAAAVEQISEGLWRATRRYLTTEDYPFLCRAAHELVMAEDRLRDAEHRRNMERLARQSRSARSQERMLWVVVPAIIFAILVAFTALVGGDGDGPGVDFSDANTHNGD